MTYRKRKGAGKPAPHTHRYLNRIQNTCLFLFAAFVILFIGGIYIHNDPVTYLGLGVGAAGFVLQVIMNAGDEDD